MFLRYQFLYWPTIICTKAICNSIYPLHYHVTARTTRMKQMIVRFGGRSRRFRRAYAQSSDPRTLTCTTGFLPPFLPEAMSHITTLRCLRW